VLKAKVAGSVSCGDRSLVLEAEGDFVGWNRTFAEDHPGVAAAGEIYDGGGDGAGCGTTVDDERQLVAKLFADAGGRGAFGQAGEIRGGRGDGQTKAADDGAGDGGLGYAESEVAGVGGDAEGESAAGFDDDGERAGPELFCKAVEGGVDLAGELVGLGDLGDEEREWLVAGAGFELVDAVDGLEIDWIDGEAVEGVGRESDDVTAVEAGDDVVDERGLGLFGMNTEGFGDQMLAPVVWALQPPLPT
jgi:hypothetical protein